MAINTLDSEAKNLGKSTPLKSRSNYGRNADGSRQGPVGQWVSRLVMLVVLLLFSLPL